MNRKEISEIKKRFTKTSASFSRMAGCYINLNREKVCTFNESFLNLPEEEFYKYLEIAAKTLSGTPGNQLVGLSFPREAEDEGGVQSLLLALRDSGLKDESLLDAWYDRVIGSYHHPGNYLILLFADTYDVPKKTSDGLALDESEEVYRYILCSICPVELSKPGLGYREAENCFGACSRSWVVGAPESGFLFPAFNDRSADIHETLFYAKDPREPHEELMTEILSCPAVFTAAEQKISFGETVLDVLGDDARSEDMLLDIHQQLEDLRTLTEEPETEEPCLLTADIMERALKCSCVPGETAGKIVQAVDELFAEEKPPVAHVVDTRALKTNAYRIERNELRRALEDTRSELAEATGEAGGYDVVLHLSPEKAERLDARYIDGEKYLLIPLEGSESISVNGVDTEV